MNRDWARLPHLGRARAIEEALHRLEGWTYGPALRFSVYGYEDELRINIGTDTEVEKFGRLPGIREFAEDLNRAMAPVIESYRLHLRDELAKELTRTANRALDHDAGCTRPPSGE